VGGRGRRDRERESKERNNEKRSEGKRRAEKVIITRRAEKRRDEK
jgi:hypothetical protein